jgi:hypothetical protein
MTIRFGSGVVLTLVLALAAGGAAAQPAAPQSPGSTPAPAHPHGADHSRMGPGDHPPMPGMGQPGGGAAPAAPRPPAPAPPPRG